MYVLAVALIVKAGGLHNHGVVHCASDDELFPQSSSTGPSCGFDETLSVFFHLMQPGRVVWLWTLVSSWMLRVRLGGCIDCEGRRLAQPRSC